MIMETKTCSKCGETKALELFRQGRNQCKLCIAKIQKAYNEKNKESIAEYMKEYYAKNSAHLKAYKAKNRERIAEYMKGYYAQNRERMKEYTRTHRTGGISKAEIHKGHRSVGRVGVKPKNRK